MVTLEQPGSARLERWHRTAAVGLVVVFVLLVVYSASHVRGADQFWYVADIEALLAGDHSTNHTFARFAYRGDPTVRPGFVHDNLSLYLALPAATLFGAFAGWLMTNVVLVLIGAALVGGLVRRLSGRATTALGAFALTLFNPVTFWQASQPLVDAMLLPLVAAAVWVYVLHRRSPWRYARLMLLIGVAYLMRSSFMPLILALPVLYLLERDADRFSPRSLGGAALLGVAAVGVIALPGVLFEQSMPASIHEIMINGVPGRSDMDYLVSYQPLAFGPEAVLGKWVVSLRYQLGLAAAHVQVFYLPFNLMTLLVLARLWQTRGAARRLHLCALALVGLHLLTILIHQNQFRYLLVPLPAVLAAALVELDRLLAQHRSLSRAALAAAVAGHVVLCVGLAHHLRASGQTDHRTVTEIAKALAPHVDADDRVMVCHRARFGTLVAYALRPTLTMEVAEYLPPWEFEAIDRRYDAHWLACPRVVVDKLDLPDKPIAVLFPEPIADYVLVRLP